MTLSHLLRTVMVAGCAAAVLAYAAQAHAEGGSEDRFPGVTAPEPAPQVEAAAAPAASPSVAPDAAIGRQVRSRVARVTRSIGDDPERARSLRPLIEKYAREHGVPVDLADAVVRIESRYNPGARNGPNLGLTQINPRTARGLGYAGTVAGLMDPETNLQWGIKYLADAYRLAGGDTCGTVLRYQAGHGAKTMTRAARVYCGKVRTLLAANE